MTRGPIFIGGLDRSGKTLLRLSLSSHPNIALTRRTYMWPRFYNRYGDLSQPENFERCLQAMLQHKPTRMLQPDPERIRREFGQGEPSYARLFALFHQHYAERLGKPRWGDQTGLIERYADPIFAAYPTAVMLHLIRDPRDRYGAAVPRSKQGKGRAGEATARWLYSVGWAERNQRRYPERYKIVRYENLMTQREATLRDVCSFIGEEYAPAMLTLEHAIRFGDEKDDETPVKQDQHDDMAFSTDQVQPAVPKREIAFMQAYAGRAMATYGYTTEPIAWSLRDRVLFSLIDWPTNVARMTAWQRRESKRLTRP